MKNSPNKYYRKQRTTQSHSLQLAAAIIETIYAIPILGGLFIFWLIWIPLVATLVIHTVTLIITVQDERSPVPSIIGILASTLGIIPILGWMLHVAAAIFNWIGYSRKD